MIISINEKLDVTPEWFENQVKAALDTADAATVEKLSLPRLCQILAIYHCADKAAAETAAKKMNALIRSNLIDEAVS